MAEPKIITGSINTNDYAEREMEHPGEEAQETNMIVLSSQKKGGGRGKTRRHFKSLFPNLRISVLHTYDRVAADGSVMPGINEVIKFKGYDYITQDKKEIVAIEECTEYGINVYDHDQWLTLTEKAKVDSMAKQLADDPDLKARVMNALKVKEGADDFEAPPEEEKPKEE